MAFLCVTSRLEGTGEGGVAGGELELTEEQDGTNSIEDVLAQLNLENLARVFQKEEIDFDSLVSAMILPVAGMLCALFPSSCVLMKI